jgi:phosphoribosylcarboxyaminoimidazole (NCAIR) mutase
MDKNLTREEIELDEKLHPWELVKLRTYTHTCRVLGAHRVPNKFVNNRSKINESGLDILV